MLNYKIGQKYEAHFDYFHDQWNKDPSKGGQRLATVLMYLSDVEVRPLYCLLPSSSSSPSLSFLLPPSKGGQRLATVLVYLSDVEVRPFYFSFTFSSSLLRLILSFLLPL